MKMIQDRLQTVEKHIKENDIKIMIFGLGSVGLYLLDYIISRGDAAVTLIVVGRDYDKMEKDVNVIKVASLIRGCNKSTVLLEGNVDFNDTNQMEVCIRTHKPDFIINTSRVYSGLKYGSISWNKVRAYGIWAPLAIKYIKNIMEACECAESHAIVINTSYSDAVIPWLKGAGKSYPDFGSGNLNHLIPRIKFAVAEELEIQDYWNIDITYATSHFHDVVISKEGQTEGVEQLISIVYQDKVIEMNMNRIFAKCNIPMPIDAKRNMMNASSNYEIIFSIIEAVREKKQKKFHSPGALGELGGYPVIIDATGEHTDIHIDESKFSLHEMQKKNRESIALDGIEDIEKDTLVYTDALIEKVQKAFRVNLVKRVGYAEIDKTAELLIENIIKKSQKESG